MPRIRTIKPEFPQSESMGRVSREARLLFVLLWTVCDDHGRTRAASRMLASLLYPYDDDAGRKIDAWLGELEREKCIVRYQVDGATYLEICNWLSHQKIDRPSQSKLPPFDESSRILANPREGSSGDLGSGSGPVPGSGPRTKEASFDAGRVDGLDLESWSRWLAYRKEVGKPIKTRSSLEAAAQEMAKLGARQAEAVQHSIASQYQGCYLPKANAPPNGVRPTRYEQVMSALDKWDPNDTRTDETPLAIAGPDVGQPVR